MKNIKNFRKILPPDLVGRAISLEDIGHDEYIWKYEDSLDVIDILTDNNYRVLGGDVYTLIEGKFKPTYDNWYIGKNANDSTESILQRSRIISRDYIIKYVKKNGKNFYFAIVANFNK